MWHPVCVFTIGVHIESTYARVLCVHMYRCSGRTRIINTQVGRYIGDVSERYWNSSAVGLETFFSPRFSFRFTSPRPRFVFLLYFENRFEVEVVIACWTRRDKSPMMITIITIMFERGLLLFSRFRENRRGSVDEQ